MGNKMAKKEKEKKIVEEAKVVEEILANDKPYNEKDIIERHTREGQFYIGNALVEMEARVKLTEAKLERAEQALSFLATWWEEKHGTGLIVPETPKLIL